jgi:uncharacterized protein with PQ loop repeat
MDMPDLIGLTGAVIAGYAYVPQITHLIKERCSAGISRRAFALWFLSSLLVTINALFIQSAVFILWELSRSVPLRLSICTAQDTKG